MPQSDKLIMEMKSKGEYDVTCGKLQLKVFQDVFYYFDSEFMANNLVIPTSSRVLDLGCGTGVLGFVASENANEVICADISSKAVECTEYNVNYLKLSDKVKVVQSDLFQNITGLFDVIIFNIPFNAEKDGLDDLGKSMYDKDGKLLIRFLDESKNYLTKGGKIILAYSSFGRLDILHKECKDLNYVIKTITSMKVNTEDYIKDEFYIFEITNLLS